MRIGALMPGFSGAHAPILCVRAKPGTDVQIRRVRAMRGAHALPWVPTGFLHFGAIFRVFAISGSSGPPKNIPGPVLRSSFRCGRSEYHIDIFPENFTGAELCRSVVFPNRKIEYSQLPLHLDRKSTRLNSSHVALSRMPSSA